MGVTVADCLRLPALRQAELAALMEEGDMVAIVGSVRTSPSKKDERITNENIICKDIAAIPSEEE